MTLLFSIGLGGAIGAILRYLSMSLVSAPWGTMSINIIGSFMLGSFLELSALKWDISPELRAFIVIGLLGAFTTFSTFSMDTVYLLQKGDLKTATFYMFASVILGLLAFIFGMWIFRQILG